jgi:HAMP domain-containing protein/CheY-like chemotaxis protein
MSTPETPPAEPAETLSQRQVLAALRALSRGEFDARLPDGHTGVDGELASVFNELAQRVQGLEGAYSELSTAVGREGRTHRRLDRTDHGGGWARMIDASNQLLDDVFRNVDEMAEVVVAVADGDLTRRIDLDGYDAPLRGSFKRNAMAVNGMADQLQVFGTEVTRVALDVGVAGRLGVVAEVPGAKGTWRQLTDAVNTMANNLTAQVRDIAAVTRAVAQGDLTKKVDIEVSGEIRELKTTINTMVDQLSAVADQVSSVARQVGTEGILGGQAEVPGVSGVWKELTDNVNMMADNLTGQVRNIAEVARAIADGDLSRKVTVEVRGEILELKNTVNRMVEQVAEVTSEVTRVAREVGTDGVLGGEAEVPKASGVWRDLTSSVNGMAMNLTGQVRNISEVVTAIAEGDLSRKITVDAKGEILALKVTINDTVDKLNTFAAEVTRVARLVGTEGILGVQADVKGVSGVWRDLTDNVNTMGRNLTDQVRDIAQVTTAVAEGDLSRKITVEVRGELAQLKHTINEMVDSLSSFADEVSRVAREVGTEGVLGGQAEVSDAEGTWRELTDNVNRMALNLTDQVRNIAEVASAVAQGDLSRTITVDAKGEVLALKETINTMVGQLNGFSAEVTRVAREVGVEGQLGGQASVPDASGVWRELTDNVNMMANNLTNQVRDIAEVTTAVANGDLGRKITVDAKGEILELKNTVNTMVDQLSSFADEVTWLALEVGTEGNLGGQADVRGVSGRWRELTDAVNSMAANLTVQVRSIAQVSTAIADGDLRRKIVVEAKGEILELKETINLMVDQLNSFASEVTRVSREVGVEGQLGGQARVEGVRGTWKELTDNVNMMASNLTGQVRDIIRVSTAIAHGDLSKKVVVDVRGEMLELKSTINSMVDQLGSFADEVNRVAREVGVEGKLGGQAEVRGAAGVWGELTGNVNMMATNLTDQVRDIAQITTAVANGDLSRKITAEARGEILQLKNTINTMVDQLSAFANEVTRVAREVGTEGVLGGQAQVPGASGVWFELTENVNTMATNLTEQVRGIARVVTAVANGDLDQELRLQAQGEIATLVATINSMMVTLSTFAEQVSGVARDVGVEGRLGGQADVPGAAGVWRDLTRNVNELAGNLTRQVRAIADVATAVTNGDLTQSIDVQAHGEVAELKDNINQMILTLAETTRVNEQQDWLKTNLTRFTRMLQGQRSLSAVADQVITELAPTVEAQFGAFFLSDRSQKDDWVLQLFASYAYTERKHLSSTYGVGEGLVGQAAREGKRIVLREVPRDFVMISSGLGASAPNSIVVVPILFEGEVKGVIELATLGEFSPTELAFLDQLAESLGIVIASLEATARTDELLRESQSMAEELQTQQEELRQTNEELEEKARELVQQRDQVERKNREVELARQELEEKAEQLALTSRYKSEFLANMSHELRTPLNALLILSRQLADNRAEHLDDREVEYARTIHQSGADLLELINEILDLAKIESGTMAIDPAEVSLEGLESYVSRTFEEVARDKGLDFDVQREEGLPDGVYTDEMRLKQVLRNLLSNALKFTHDGAVQLRMRPVDRVGPGRDEPGVAFVVNDSGIGIPAEKMQVIFEAFQQADGSTSRTYGGTGLGLSISREIAGLLGGTLTATSKVGEGSTFELRIPLSVDTSGDTEPPPPPPEPRVVERTTSDGTERATLMPTAPRVADDRSRIRPGDAVLLIIEDDLPFAKVVMGIARDHGFKSIVARTGEEALALARELRPHAISLDLRLPDMDGWVLLDILKHDAALRHIPVHVLSGEPDEARALRQGAVAVLQKPVEADVLGAAFDDIHDFLERKVRRLLVVEDNDVARQSIVELVDDDDIEVVGVSTGEAALASLLSETFDCCVLDLGLPSMSGLQLVEKIREEPALQKLPIIIYTGRELDREEEVALQRVTESIIVKDVSSADRLLAETALFLHRVERRDRRVEAPSDRGDAGIDGARVLIVDDDVRNIFALTALLEEQGVTVSYAENGKQALARLEDSEVDLVLMDIMMPEMDGYEATRAIRAQERFSDLPVIAVTAKAMRGDRARCLEAGASDYITKPVDPDRLMSLLRVWLYR